MKIELAFNGKRFTADLSNPLDISIPLAAGTANPNCYYADPVVFETISSGDFIGSVEKGGSVNYQKLTLTPHGNGTHTECYGHISPDKSITINQCLQTFHFFAQLISVEPIASESGDLIITAEALEDKLSGSEPEAVIIRTLPNNSAKLRRQYSNTNPPYVSKEAADLLVNNGVQHLLIDLPSVDREVDQGKLSAHKAFWNFPAKPRKHATITELIYVPDSIDDGAFLLNLQIASLEMDASPSKPVLFKLEEVY